MTLPKTTGELTQEQIAEIQNPFVEFVYRYGPHAGEEGPVKFAKEVFGYTLDPWQEDCLRAYGRGDIDIAIAACNGPGKTFTVSVMIWHQLVTKFPQHTIATAPSKGQLDDGLVKEAEMRYTHLPEKLQKLFTVQKYHIYLNAAPKFSFFRAKTARAEKPEAFQGIHCEGGWLLLIADEASGVDEKIFEAGEGAMAGDNTLTVLMGNPQRTSGTFFDAFHKLRGEYYHRNISWKDSSRVNEAYERRMRIKYGEKSNTYRVKVLGQFPKADDDTVISWDLATSAQERDIFIPKDNLKTVWGVDVARFGDDATTLIKRSSFHVFGMRRWSGADLMETVGKIKLAYDNEKQGLKPKIILIDSIGVGAGVVDRLYELGYPVRGVNVGEVASLDEDTYADLRSELWFQARQWLGERTKKLPACTKACTDKRDCIHNDLIAELVSVRYKYKSNGKLIVESKADMKKRGVASPNLAEAFILSHADDPVSVLANGRFAAGFRFNQHSAYKHSQNSYALRHLGQIV